MIKHLVRLFNFLFIWQPLCFIIIHIWKFLMVSKQVPNIYSSSSLIFSLFGVFELSSSVLCEIEVLSLLIGELLLLSVSDEFLNYVEFFFV